MLGLLSMPFLLYLVVTELDDEEWDQVYALKKELAPLDVQAPLRPDVASLVDHAVEEPGPDLEDLFERLESSRIYGPPDPESMAVSPKHDAQRRLEEERRRLHLLGKLREAILARRHWDMWLAETRGRLAERERRRIMKLNLKGCRVGVQIGRAKRPRREDWVISDDGAVNSDDFSVLSIMDIVEPVLVDKNAGGKRDTDFSAGAGRIYWKVPVLTRMPDISGDPLARRLRSRAFQACSHSTDLEAPVGSSAAALAREELVYAEGVAVSSCLRFVPGWRPGEDALVDHLTGSSGLILVDVDADALGRALSAASNVWRGPKLPILVVVADGTPPAHAIESGFPVRTVPMDEGFTDAVRWLASACPPQPSFLVTTLKDCISQGIRSMVYSSSREEGAIELVLSAIDDAHESMEAQWQWPPREFDIRCGGVIFDDGEGYELNEWWTSYERLVLAVRSIYASMEGKAGLSLLAVNQVLDRGRGGPQRLFSMLTFCVRLAYV